MIKLLTALLVSLALCSCVQNKQQIDKGKEQIDNDCDQFMQLFVKNRFPEAFELLKQRSPLSPSTIDTLKVKTIEYANNAFSSYGKIRSYEFISEHRVKDLIARRFYILKFDKFYLKFAFTLYNNGTGWTITEFIYNEELNDLLY